MALSVATGITCLAPAAEAADTVSVRGVDWEKIVVGLDRIARNGTERPVVSNAANSHIATSISDDPNPQSLGNAWFGVVPRVSLVARDWGSSTRLAGDKLSLVDAMRLSASTRMVVGRARLSGGTRFSPFLQVGLGQWRVDHNYLPLTPHCIDIASQVGAGFEIRLTRKWQLAAETTVTTLFREELNNSQPQTLLWSSFLASRVEF